MGHSKKGTVIVPFQGSVFCDPHHYSVGLEYVIEAVQHATKRGVRTRKFSYDTGFSSYGNTATSLAFYEAIGICSNAEFQDGIIWLCGGGVGAARVVNNLTVEYRKASDRPSRAFGCVGSSDACLYPLASWLLYSAIGVFGPCLDTTRFCALPFTETVSLIYPKSKKTVVHAQLPLASCVEPLSETGSFSNLALSAVPVTIHSLALLGGATRIKLLEYLSSRPCLLLLEDVYAGGEAAAWISFYDDLTQIIPYLEAVSHGDGLVVFSYLDLGKTGPSPVSFVADAYRYLKGSFYPRTLYMGAFGHVDCFSVPILYGQTVLASYYSSEGQLVINF